jgi:hypothetical protein
MWSPSGDVRSLRLAAGSASAFGVRGTAIRFTPAAPLKPALPLRGVEPDRKTPSFENDSPRAALCRAASTTDLEEERLLMGDAAKEFTA